MSKKHPQFILAVDNRPLKSMQYGITKITVARFAELVQGALVIRERAWLEEDVGYRQLLPYVAIRQRGEDGKLRYITYRRGKGVGEARLAGNASIGFGGHIDLEDVVSENSVVNLERTIRTAMARELAEELRFHGVEDINGVDIGLISDTSNAVGLVHLGVLMVAEIGPEAEVACAEEELEMLPAMTAEELLASDLPLENWTRIALEFFIAEQAA